MNHVEELLSAVRALPDSLAHQMASALDEGTTVIGAGSYETELARCPFAAAAARVGRWGPEGYTGNDEWGTPDGPSEAVEEFVVHFDWYAEEIGLHEAIDATRRALGLASLRRTGATLRSGHSRGPAKGTFVRLRTAARGSIIAVATRQGP
jgi:hypothetical protein